MFSCATGGKQVIRNWKYNGESKYITQKWRFFFDIPSLEGDFLKRAFVSAVEQSRIHLGFPYTFR